MATRYASHFGRGAEVRGGEGCHCEHPLYLHGCSPNLILFVVAIALYVVNVLESPSINERPAQSLRLPMSPHQCRAGAHFAKRMCYSRRKRPSPTIPTATTFVLTYPTKYRPLFRFFLEKRRNQKMTSLCSATRKQASASHSRGSNAASTSAVRK